MLIGLYLKGRITSIACRTVTQMAIRGKDAKVVIEGAVPVVEPPVRLAFEI